MLSSNTLCSWIVCTSNWAYHRPGSMTSGTKPGLYAKQLSAHWTTSKPCVCTTAVICPSRTPRAAHRSELPLCTDIVWFGNEARTTQWTHLSQALSPQDPSPWASSARAPVTYVVTILLQFDFRPQSNTAWYETGTKHSYDQEARQVCPFTHLLGPPSHAKACTWWCMSAHLPLGMLELTAESSNLPCLKVWSNMLPILYPLPV